MTLPTDPSSYWLDQLHTTIAQPPLEGEHESDVVILGAGIVGACLSRCFVSEGMGVVLLDADRVGRGATGRNAGFLLAEGSETSAEVSRTHGLATAKALRGAGLRTRERLSWLTGDRDLGLRRTGSLRLALDDGEARDLSETARAVRTGLRYLEERELPSTYQDRGFIAGLVDPADGLVRPLSLLGSVIGMAFDQQRARDGVMEIFEHSPALAVVEQDDAVLVRTPLGSVRAKRAVLTTNAWINRLLPNGPFVRPVRAQMLAARVDPVRAWDMPVYADHGADYWRLADDGTVLIGGKRLVGGPTEETDDANPAAPVQPALDALLRRLVGPGAKIDVLTRWAGTMGFTADGIPVVGLVPGCERTFVLGGCNGHGMGWGPGLACMLADAMTGRGEGIPACFDPARAAVMRGS